MDDYELLDSGEGKKLERFGPYTIARPCAQAVWKPLLPHSEWAQAHATFTREPENLWTFRTQLPDSWIIVIEGIRFKISPTDFGHLGVFPEQKKFWSQMQQELKDTHSQVLNLFAYSGGSTIAPALVGAEVCHLDASKGMVTWGHENADLNQLQQAPIRWIVDDVGKFLKREIRRERKYDVIILDPPTFGRGSKGEIFKIEEALPLLLDDCRALLSEKAQWLLLSCHTPGFTPLVLRHLLSQAFSGCPSTIVEGEMLLEGKPPVLSIPSGTYASIHFHH